MRVYVSRIMMKSTGLPGTRVTGMLFACLLASACVNVPDPAVPAANLEIGAGFRGAARPTADVPTDWWDGFGDPVLTRLVSETLTRNPALTGADFSLAEARALLRLANLDRQPTLSSRVSATAARPNGPSTQIDGRLDGALVADWEFDAFGRLEALYTAAGADLAAAGELRRDIAVSLVSETALAYIDLRGAERRLSVGRSNSDAQKQALDLVQVLFENGRSTRLDLDRAEAQYRTTLASLPVFEATIAAAQNRLAALTGQPATNPAALVALAPSDAANPIPALTGALEAGDTASLLRRRPDIRLAESQLARTLALTEAARANLFPRITFNASLTSLFRVQGVAVSDESFGLAFGPAISWAGPDLRGVYASIDVADARAGAAIANYEAAVLGALAETETALSDYALERSRVSDLEAAVTAARRALVLANLRFEQGLDNFLAVLDAQRTLLDAEDMLATNQAETARRAVRAYRSLGGIWTTQDLTAFRAG